MIRGRTTSGFEFAIPEDVFDDFELVELFAKTNEDMTYIGKLTEKFLGPEQKKALMEHVRRDGKVRTSDMMTELEEIENEISKATTALKN